MGLYEYADTILFNGKVITVDAKDTIAQAVAIKDGKIVKVGKDGEVKALAGEKTQLIDLKGKTVLPGFIDAHAHVSSGGTIRTYTVSVASPPTKSISEMLDKIRLKAGETPKGNWVIAQGSLGADKFLQEKRFPTREELDRVAPNNPVFVDFYHMAVANSLALKLANITKETPNPVGGEIVKNSKTGEPTGALLETAAQLVKKVIPPFTLEQIKEGIKTAAKMYAEAGVTTVHEFLGDTTFPVSVPMRAFFELWESGELPIRVHLIVKTIGGDVTLEPLLTLGIRSGFGDEWLKIGGIKIFVDGGMTAHTAALHAPYLDKTETRGEIVIPRERLMEEVLKAHEAGIRCCIHAIGDRALDMLLEVYEEALEKIPRKDHRHRIEHGGNVFCTKERREKIKSLGVILASNPNFIVDIADKYRTYVGDEVMKSAFPFKTLAKEGVTVTAGTDGFGCPPWEPLAAICACVTRTTLKGWKVAPEEKITPLEAIKLFTVNSAYAGFEEEIKGSIEPNKLADLTILSDDPLTVLPEKIKDIEIMATIVGGKIVYSKEF